MLRQARWVGARSSREDNLVPRVRNRLIWSLPALGESPPIVHKRQRSREEGGREVAKGAAVGRGSSGRNDYHGWIPKPLMLSVPKLCPRLVKKIFF